MHINKHKLDSFYVTFPFEQHSLAKEKILSAMETTASDTLQNKDAYYNDNIQKLDWSKSNDITRPWVQLLLADEINRSPAKTHAALLEIMQESRVTIDGVTHPVPNPFLVFATQNPLESEGTYSLPEAQLDRFMFKAMVSYPSEEEEARVLEMHSRKVDMAHHLETQVENVSSAQTIQDLIHKVSQVRIEPKLLQYVNRIVRATRTWPTFHLGASPRAGVSLIQGARALAAFRGRDYAVPDDVAEIVLPTLRHRVVLGAEAEVEGLSIDQELRTLLKSIEVPRT